MGWMSVEDPSEHFVAMRDAVDAANCATLASFAPDNLKRGFAKEMAEEAHQRLKIDRVDPFHSSPFSFCNPKPALPGPDSALLRDPAFESDQDE